MGHPERGGFRAPLRNLPLTLRGEAGPPRPSCLALTGFLLLHAGCGGTLYLAANRTSPRPPAEVFDCAKGQIAVLGYTQTSLDVEGHRITARKYDWETRMADTQFRRMVERLSVEVRSSAGGSAHLRVDAHTFAELATQRGPTEMEQEASPAVRAAAQALLEACGS
jgi:hypothetical protein